MGRHGFPGIPRRHAAAFSCNGSARGICADIRISADASRRTFATKGSCMPNLRGKYTRKTMATHCTYKYLLLLLSCACAAHAQKRDRHIYIYTHRESLVRNHEPCAKTLGNNYIYIIIYSIYTDRESPVRNHEPRAKALGN